jgi:hypothetical protein
MIPLMFFKKVLIKTMLYFYKVLELGMILHAREKLKLINNI